jgi:hypothetical protein
LETKIYAQVTTTAANADIGETFSVVPAVELAEPGTPDHLLLGVPIATPTGVYPETPTSVIFRVQIDGTSAPPEVLYLDELDLAGKPLKLASCAITANARILRPGTRSTVAPSRSIVRHLSCAFGCGRHTSVKRQCLVEHPFW